MSWFLGGSSPWSVRASGTWGTTSRFSFGSRHFLVFSESTDVGMHKFLTVSSPRRSENMQWTIYWNHFWCRVKAEWLSEVVTIWYTFDAHLVHIWYIFDTHLMHTWYTSDAQLMHIWCTADAHLVHFWCTSGTYLMHIWCTSGTHLIYIWCTSDIHLI